jgi:hypothetical protein
VISAPDVGLHFEVLEWSPGERVVVGQRVGSVVYSGGVVAWEKIVSAERRWLFERLEAALGAWVGPTWAAGGGQWRLEGRLDEEDAPSYGLSWRATGEAAWSARGDAWGALTQGVRGEVLGALRDVLGHVEALLTIE